MDLSQKYNTYMPQIREKRPNVLRRGHVPKSVVSPYLALSLCAVSNQLSAPNSRKCLLTSNQNQDFDFFYT